MTIEDLVKKAEEMGPWWSCKICTYNNPDYFKTCYLCGADKEGEGAMGIMEAADELVGGITYSKVKRLVK